MDRKYSRVKSVARSSRRHSATHGLFQQDVQSSIHSDNIPLQYNPKTETIKVHEAHQKQNKLPFYHMWRYATKFDISLIVIGTIFAIACAALLPYLIHYFGEMVGNGLDDARCFNFIKSSKDFQKKLSEKYVGEFIQTTFILASMMMFLCYASVSCFSFAAENQIYKLRIAYFESIFRKDMSWLDSYVEREFGGHMTHDITQIRAGIGEKVAYLVYVVTVVFCLIVTAIIAEWKTALLLLCLAPIVGIISYLSSIAELKESDYEEMSYTAADVTAEEILSNIKTVKIYEGEAKAIGRYESVLQPESKVWKWIFIYGISAASLWFFVYSSYGVVFFFGSKHLIAGLRNESECRAGLDHTKGPENSDGPKSLFVIFFCVIFASLHMGEISVIINGINHTRHVASEVFFMIDWISKIDNMSRQGEIPSRTAIGKIEMKGVGFRYPRKPEDIALHNIKITIHPGQLVALVGGVGSGKSTVLRLVQRLYDPTTGKVFLDGRNLEALNVGWLRSQIGVLSQEPVLFNRTVEVNVRFAKWSATLTEVQEACRMAGIHDDILQMKEGYQTVVGQSGNLLSLIQKRQVSFARVFLQHPKILLLDDPVDPSDTEFGEIILRVVSHLRENTTIVITASEVNPIVEQSDKIYVLDKGFIMEGGNHDELMVKNGIYAGIKNQTFTAYEDRNPVHSQFISQLTSYRFAQSLRRMHLRKSLEVKNDTHHHIGEINETSFENEDNSGASEHSVYPRKHRKTKNLGMRIAGGLQQYNYARATSDPNHLKQIFDKGIHKIQREKAYRTNRSEVDKSINLILKDIHENQPSTSPSHVRFVLPEIISTNNLGSISSSIVLPLPKSMEADNRSVASKDSEEFWNAYMDILNNLEGLHKITSWKDLLILGLPGWKYMIPSFLVSALMGIYSPVFAHFYGEMFGFLVLPETDKALSKGNEYSLFLVLLGVCATLTAFAQETILSLGGYDMTLRLRKLVFTQILKQKMEWFDLPENDISFLCARLSSDIASIENLLMMAVGVIIQSLSTLTATIVIAYLLPFPHNQLVSLILIMSFFILLVIYIDGWFQLKWENITDNIYKDASMLEIEVVTNIRTVIMLGLEDHFLSEFLTDLHQPKKKLVLLNQSRAILFSLSLGFPYLCYIFMIFLYCQHVKEYPDEIENFKNFIKLGELLLFGIIPVGIGLSLIPNSEASRGAAYRIKRIMNSNPDPDNVGLEKRTYDTPPVIEVQDLAFILPDQRDTNAALKTLTFTVKSAGLVALVGPSGSGKSTVINLILRLYDPASGFIKFDGEDTSIINIKSTRRITSLIEQNPSIFDLTIRENIAYGDNSRDVPLEEIIQAAELAEVHDEIMSLDMNYETQISSLDLRHHRSFALRQRIVIARAVLRDPKLLLIDEATASSDFDSDFLLLQALDRCHLNRTTIVASQRIEPIRNADLILVMNNGEFIEVGTDHELLLQRGLYFNMYMGQRVVEGYEDNPETFARERLESLGGGSNESFNTKRRRRRSSVAYNNYLQIRLTNSVPKHQIGSNSTILMEDDQNWDLSLSNPDFNWSFDSNSEDKFLRQSK